MAPGLDDGIGPPTSGLLQLNVKRHGTTSTLALAGECDLAQEQRVHKALREITDQRPECVVLDLAELSFIDSTGISIVIGLTESSKRDGFRLVICPGPPAVQRIFDLTGLTSSLPFLPSTDATKPT